MSNTTIKKTVIKMKPITEAAFERMSIANRRIALCEDVLARMAARKFTFRQGIYCDINADYSHIVADKFRKAESLKDFLNSPTANSNHCHVCAKGALVISWIANFNKYGKNKIDNIDNSTLPELRELFSADLLNELESIFERAIDDEDARKDFRKALLNIIENKGVLIWEGEIYGKIPNKIRAFA